MDWFDCLLQHRLCMLPSVACEGPGVVDDSRVPCAQMLPRCAACEATPMAEGGKEHHAVLWLAISVVVLGLVGALVALLHAVSSRALTLSSYVFAVCMCACICVRMHGRL